jgi:transposase
VIYYQYKADRARRTLRGIDEQIAKAEKAVAGKTAVKRNRFVRLTGATKTVNRTLEDKARSLAGLKGYVTNLDPAAGATAEFVINAYHRLFQIEKSFRMSKHDLQARPIYHHKRESIEAHLTIVFAALAVGRWIEDTTGWSIKKFVRTARRYRTIQIQAGQHTLTAQLRAFRSRRGHGSLWRRPRPDRSRRTGSRPETPVYASSASRSSNCWSVP